MLWTRHYIFFRRYGLGDTTTLLWNAVLMFVTLIYVYPLRFLFGYLCDGMWYLTGVLPKEFQDDVVLRLEHSVTTEQARGMMVLYGAGYAAVSLTFDWMHRHALRRAQELELDSRELVLTRHEIWSNGASAGVALLSIVVALVSRPDLAGWLYFLLFPLGWYGGVRLGRAMKRVDVAGR